MPARRLGASRPAIPIAPGTIGTIAFQGLAFTSLLDLALTQAREIDC